MRRACIYSFKLVQLYNIYVMNLLAGVAVCKCMCVCSFFYPSRLIFSDVCDLVAHKIGICSTKSNVRLLLLLWFSGIQTTTSMGWLCVARYVRDTSVSIYLPSRNVSKLSPKLHSVSFDALEIDIHKHILYASRGSIYYYIIPHIANIYNTLHYYSIHFVRLMLLLDGWIDLRLNHSVDYYAHWLRLIKLK